MLFRANQGSLSRRAGLSAVALLLLAVFLHGCREATEKEATDKMELAEAALRAEEWEKADGFFYEALLLDPDRAEAWVGRGMTLTQLGRIDDAQSHYEQALELYEKQAREDPLAREPLRGRILLLVLLDRDEEAAAVAAEAARERADPAFSRELSSLVQRYQRNFPDMILPATSAEQPPEKRGETSSSP